MKKVKTPARGGRYFKPSQDSDPIFVEGTDRKPTEAEKRALEAEKNPPKAKKPTEGGGDK